MDREKAEEVVATARVREERAADRAAGDWARAAVDSVLEASAYAPHAGRHCSTSRGSRVCRESVLNAARL